MSLLADDDFTDFGGDVAVRTPQLLDGLQIFGFRFIELRVGIDQEHLRWNETARRNKTHCLVIGEIGQRLKQAKQFEQVDAASNHDRRDDP